MTKIRVNLSIDQALWSRCQAYKGKLDINWSELTELGFRTYLAALESVLKSFYEGKSIDDLGKDALLHLQSEYYKSISDTYASIAEMEQLKSETLAKSA